MLYPHPPTHPPTHLLLRVEGGDEEGLGLHGVPGRKKPSPVVDDAPRRQTDTEVRWNDELHGCEVAGLERSGGNQEVPTQVQRGPLHSLGEWNSPGTLLDGRGSFVVLRVLKHHLRRGDEAFLGVRGVGVVDEQVRKEFDLS